MMAGGLIMILGVIIQVTAMKGHKATAQFIVGRIVTGVGNGIVNTLDYLLGTADNDRTHLPSLHTKPNVVELLTVVSLSVSKVASLRSAH